MVGRLDQVRHEDHWPLRGAKWMGAEPDRRIGMARVGMACCRSDSGVQLGHLGVDTHRPRKLVMQHGRQHS